jgi:hypothetical protein
MPSSESISQQQNNLKKIIYEIFITGKKEKKKKKTYFKHKSSTPRDKTPKQDVEEEGSAAEQSNLFQNLRCAKIHQNGKTTSSEMLAIHRADGRAAEPQQL